MKKCGGTLLVFAAQTGAGFTKVYGPWYFMLHFAF